MNKLECNLPFDSSEINILNYTADLLRLCCSHNLIPEHKLMEIRNGFDKSFIETAEQFVKRESSSIPKKRAEILYSSVLYQSDVYLMSLNSINKSVEALNNLSTEKILSYGRSLIQDIHNKNIRIFKQAYKRKLNLPVIEYRLVMDKAFDDYYKSYSARFDARNCCALIDYPLLGKPAYSLKSQGALFIHEYYTGIMYENEFCSFFAENEIEDFLKAYGKMYGCVYTDLLFNITEVLLNNLLVCAILDKPLFELYPKMEDINKLKTIFRKTSVNDKLHKFKSAFNKYESVFHDLRCYEYLYRYIPLFSMDFNRCIQNNRMENFIIARS